MKTLYDVQQLLKRFGVFVYVGKRLWDIELMALELDHLRESDVIDKETFIKAKLVIEREHRIEEQREQEKNKS
ncbi:YqgQ family protein [Ligilactobacillus acidipiscis]|uniref:Cytosolic protein n=1 Tax=Ligilactobacillus acidipiscis TaxID=89059 RepID=A0A1K1KNH0_9LACO|nr:YqgQ family protein [Ligilactobacillus acidipiscis]MCI1925343.1 YqgQ family protein [Ligilactobacillus acidipiscis]MCI1954213.1 YqgQ family protein [Ligilactobacillus acidipiscis]WEV57969.1 YqgQ family protein [Ligilactobacillus acidipiscis]SFV40432.1 hypothetical protein LAC1533_1012 [Ligilactobacillus acidipiscis]GAW64610.1 hypothetical protein Lacidipiscis_01814 [Ligilactobacillus acidipiscis]